MKEEKIVKSRDQERAKHALKKLEGRKKILKDKDIKSAVSGLPAMIHMNGLGHAFAFFLSDPDKFPERKWLVETVFDWLKNHSGVYKSLDNQTNLTPLKAVTLSSLTTHQIAQQEAQAYLLWLKKFARALLNSEDTNQEGN
ncbi:MAG: type III-B CRISPR module-associated protein Cmr5 [Moraxellaceae bacterium]|nr:type III-B CRISPR module-associated protein Cmr5 [Moraxellaceae bacterium]